MPSGQRWTRIKAGGGRDFEPFSHFLVSECDQRLVVRRENVISPGPPYEHANELPAAGARPDHFRDDQVQARIGPPSTRGDDVAMTIEWTQNLLAPVREGDDGSRRVGNGG
jgi:hypothetical protein